MTRKFFLIYYFIATCLLFSCKQRSIEPSNKLLEESSGQEETIVPFLFQSNDPIFLKILSLPKTESGPNPGKLIFSENGEEKTLDISMSQRGNSSAYICHFTKFEFSILNKEEEKGSLFQGIDKVKIGPHCNDGPEDRESSLGYCEFGTPSCNYGAIFDHEKAAHRESFVYHMLHILGYSAQLSRPARITYHCQTSTHGCESFGFSQLSAETDTFDITKDAFIFEFKKAVKDRLHLPEREESLDNPWTTEDGAKLDKVATLKVLLFESLIGNEDWRLNNLGSSAHVCPNLNMSMLIKKDGSYLPVPNDFDRSSFVNGKPKDEDFAYLEPRIQLIKNLYDNDSFSAARESFLQSESKIFDALGQYPMDAYGKTNAENHLQKFYEIIKKY